MPLYEYLCKKDGHFELIRKFSDPPLKACPTCGRKVEKLPSSPAIQFKGTGWYVTDYARKGKDGSAKEGKESKDSKDSGSSPKSDGASKSDGSSKSDGASKSESASKSDGSSSKTDSSSSSSKPAATSSGGSSAK